MSVEKIIKINGIDILFFGTVKGLVSERTKLRSAFEKFNPELLILGIAPEELEGLKKYLEEPFDIDPGDYEIIYAKKLEEFGEVGLPVPTYLEAFSLANTRNVEMIPVDMPDDIYTDLYSRKLDFLKIMRYDMRKRKVWKKDFKATTPEEFVIEWDKEVNKIKEFREIEEERERFMASKISEVLGDKKVSRAIVVVELERLDGIISSISQ